ATGVYAAVIEEGTESQVTAGGGFLAMEYVRGIADGAFQVDLTVAADDLDASKACEVVVWQQDTPPDAETILARAGLNVAGSVLGEHVVADVKAAPAAGGLTVNVAGSRFGRPSGGYAAMIEPGPERDLTAGGGCLAMEYVRGITGGAFTVDLTAAAADLDRSKSYEVLVWQQHTLPNADTILARSAIVITPAQWATLTDGTTPPVTDPPTKPNPPTTPTTPTQPVAGGSLRWAISSSFVSYVTGPIAQGDITVSGGATRSGSQFQFGQAAGSTYNPATGLGTVGYNGSVRFTGHHGVLDVTVSNPRIGSTSASSGKLYVTHAGSRVDF